MSKWFLNHRQEFIAAQLRAFGQIRRKDLCDRFEITLAVASADLSTFIAKHPDALIYDGRAKTYVVNCEALPADPAD